MLYIVDHEDLLLRKGQGSGRRNAMYQYAEEAFGERMRDDGRGRIESDENGAGRLKACV